MEKIIITIEDGLTPQEEILAIAKKLGKALSPPKNVKAIGTGYEVKKLETQITIKREPKSPLLVTQVCSVCETLFEPKEGFILYVNYGGNTKQCRYCCEECRNVVIDVCGEGRTSLKKSGLKPPVTYNTSTRHERSQSIEYPKSLKDMNPFKQWVKKD